MGTNAERQPRLLIAAATRDRAQAVARAHGLGPGQYLRLTYESHRAFPDLPLHIDPSWAAHPKVDSLEPIIALRIRAATSTPDQMRWHVAYLRRA